MEVKIESKIGRLRSDEHRIYTFLSDCNNFQFAANDKVKDWQSDSDSCRFSIDGIGELIFHIVERRPNDLIKFTIENVKAGNMFLWVQLKGVNQTETRLKLTTKLELNPVLNMMISKPLKQALDKVVETLEIFCR